MCAGIGNWTRIPLTDGSAFNLRTTSSTWACVASPGKCSLTEPMPSSSQALPFDATYAAESGRSPTSTVANVGLRLPAAVRRATSTATSSRTFWPIIFPSMICAVMFGS